MTDPVIPALPAVAYPSGSGHAAGSDTSAAREAKQDADGTTALIQGRVLDVLLRHPDGLTWKEVDDLARIGHHGQTSGALTNLRKRGNIFWLLKQRDGCHVFVHGSWRDRYQWEQLKHDEPKRTKDKNEAADQVCVGLDRYLHGGDHGSLDAWDYLKDAFAVWRKL